MTNQPLLTLTHFPQLALSAIPRDKLEALIAWVLAEVAPTLPPAPLCVRHHPVLQGEIDSASNGESARKHLRQQVGGEGLAAKPQGAGVGWWSVCCEPCPWEATRMLTYARYQCMSHAALSLHLSKSSVGGVPSFGTQPRNIHWSRPHTCSPLFWGTCTIWGC